MDLPNLVSLTETADAGEDAAWQEERFAEIVGENLEVAAAAGTGLFVFFALVHPFFFDPPALWALIALSLTTAIVNGTLWWLSREDRLRDDLAQPAIVFGLFMILLHTFGVARLQAAPETTAWFGLIVLAGGLLLLAWRWYAVLVVATLATWASVVVVLPDGGAWAFHAAFVLVSAIVLGSVTMWTRRRTFRDLIDRERRLRRVNEEIDRARQKAEKAERMQARFIANVSHDVRTPVSAIVAQVDELRGDHIDAEAREGLATIERSAQHLVRLIEDILDISRAEAGQLSLREEAFPIERVLQESLDMVAHRAREKGLETGIDVGDDVPRVVRGDAHRLQQVLGNLLANAVTFTLEGGVRLAVRCERREPLVLRFEVQDTGIGIPEERQGELFRPFSRIEPDPGTEGTGLGLAICKRLVEAMQGEIGVESTPGEGSTFWFTLPLAGADDADRRAAEGSVRLAGRTAWLVGSEGFPASELERWGLHVETMGGIGFVEEALADDRRPSLIVLDLVTIQAPESFLAERVRAWRARSIPVFVAKGEGQVLDELDDAAGPGTVITPSISEEELRETVLAALRTAGSTSAASRTDPELARRHPLDVLVVEDSPVNRRLLVQLLEGMGYEPATAGTGREALDRLSEQETDLVFLDLGLPDVSGEEVASRIEAEHPDTRVVALTGYTDDETRGKTEAAGVEAYVTKPVDVEDVIEQLEATPARGEAEPG